MSREDWRDLGFWVGFAGVLVIGSSIIYLVSFVVGTVLGAR